VFFYKNVKGKTILGKTIGIKKIILPFSLSGNLIHRFEAKHWIVTKLFSQN
jgi:hypothetical protein